MPNGKKGRPRRVKNKATSSISNEFCERDIAATSSPTIPENKTEFSEIQDFIEEEAQAAKDDLIRKVDEYKKAVTNEISLIKLKLGRKVLDVFEYIGKDCNGRTHTSAQTVKSLTAGQKQRKKQLSRAKETDELKSTGKKRSSSVPSPSKRKKMEGETDADGFKIPILRTRGLSQNRTNPSLIQQTPMNSRQLRGYRNIALVTPGPNIHAPVAVMRRPIAGETVISLSGSPLCISTDVPSANVANVTVPLDENKIISIFPRDGFDADDMPPLGTETKQQLVTLQEYLKDILKKC